MTSVPSDLDPAAPLTPSERVVFHGEAFSKKRSLGGAHLLGAEGKVDGSEWMHAAFLSAAVANAAAGSVRFVTETRKRLFGLVKGSELVAEPTGATVPWPDGSLEARLQALVARGRLDADTMFATLLQQDTADPEAHGLLLVQQALAQRNILEVHDKKTLVVFTTHEFVVPPASAALAASAPAGPVKAMLDAFAARDAETWKLLGSALRQAVSRRTLQQTQNYGPN